jgi:poly(A) polymerase
MTEPRNPGAGAVLEVDPLAIELGERFSTAGHQLYLVGGVVRDLVLGRAAPDADVDFATDASPQQTTKLLRGWADAVYLVGVKFGTVGARKNGRILEITTFRQEVYAEEHRKPAVTFAKDIQTDLSRRDFTINAMAMELPAASSSIPTAASATSPSESSTRRSSPRSLSPTTRSACFARPGSPRSSRSCPPRAS